MTTEEVQAHRLTRHRIDKSRREHVDDRQQNRKEESPDGHACVPDLVYTIQHALIQVTMSEDAPRRPQSPDKRTG